MEEVSTLLDGTYLVIVYHPIALHALGSYALPLGEICLYPERAVVIWFYLKQLPAKDT
jgi:hypothetical protein